MGLCWLRWSGLVLVSSKPQLVTPSDLFTLSYFEVPTRLFSLKHGASLVWGPEIVDKAILHAERVVDRKSRPYPSDLPPQPSILICEMINGRSQPRPVS